MKDEIDFQEHTATVTQPDPLESPESVPILTFLTTQVLPNLSSNPAFSPMERGGLAAVEKDLMLRQGFGLSKYGTILASHNGRQAWLDLYQELLDASFYAAQIMAESTDETPEGANKTYALLASILSIAAALKIKNEPHEVDPIELVKTGEAMRRVK